MSEATSKFVHQTMADGLIRRNGDLFINAVGLNIYQMTPEDHMVEVRCADDAQPIVILPPVTQCRGMFYSINLVEIVDDEDCIVVPYRLSPADDTLWSFFTSYLATEGDNIFLYSDGRRWLNIGCGCDATEPLNGNGV